MRKILSLIIILLSTHTNLAGEVPNFVLTNRFDEKIYFTLGNADKPPKVTNLNFLEPAENVELLLTNPASPTILVISSSIRPSLSEEINVFSFTPNKTLYIEYTAMGAIVPESNPSFSEGWTNPKKMWRWFKGTSKTKGLSLKNNIEQEDIIKKKTTVQNYPAYIKQIFNTDV